MSLLRPDEDAESALWTWAEEAVNYDPARANEVYRAVSPYRRNFARYNLPYIALPVETPPHVALSVFLKMNTRSVALTAFDIVVAQLEEASGKSLHDLVAALEGSVPDLEAYVPAAEIALPVAALLQDRSPNEAGYLNLNYDRVIAQWPDIARGAAEMVAFLGQERVPDARRLPTSSVLAPLIALWSQVPDRPDARGNARILLRKYLWRAFFTDRYDRAAATAALQDFRALRDVLNETGGHDSVPCFDATRYPLPSVESLIQAGWPKGRDRIARAILLLSLRGGAHDIADGAEATREHLRHREYHHLFPRSLVATDEYEEGAGDRALNCALITWRTNRVISAKEPVAYLLERAAAGLLGEGEVRRRLATHAIPFDPLAAGDYEQFLASRAEQLRPAMEVLSGGAPWYPTTVL